MESIHPTRSWRTFVWCGCLILVAILTTIWGQLPLLDSRPIFRIALFAGIGLLGLPLVFLFPDVGEKRASVFLIGGAILLRLTLLPAPVSDDVNRYLWEGKITLAGENPYACDAEDPARASFHDPYWEGMNNRDKPTLYPPGIQWIMAGAVAIAYQPWTTKVLALLGDLVTLGLLIRLLRQELSPLRWAGFYAFNPVVLIAFAAEAHFDSLMVAAILGTLLAHRAKRPVLTWLLFGLAIQVKFVCIILGPLLLSRRNATSLWVLALVLLIPAIPFLGGIGDWWHGVTSFAGGGFFNGPLLAGLSSLGIPQPVARTIAMAGFAAVAGATLIARYRGLPLIDATFALLGALVVCSPIVHFWYLAWILPLAALRPSFFWSMASITSAGYFIAWWNLSQHGQWGFDLRFSALLWSIPAIAFLLQNRSLRSRLKRFISPHPPNPGKPSIGLVIPTLNAGPGLAICLDSLRAEIPPETPVIIADGGSSDGSLNSIDAEILTLKPGRGEQIAAGIESLSTEWIVVIHADTLPAKGWFRHLEKTIPLHPQSAMLVMGQRFNPQRAVTLLLEALSETRVVFGGIAFGDQTMVIRRRSLIESEGFPSQPLMEDVEASIRLQSTGRILYLGREWQVSAQKWRTGFLSRFFLIIRLMITYQLARLRGRDAASAYSRKLYSDYYTSPSSSG